MFYEIVETIDTIVLASSVDIPQTSHADFSNVNENVEVIEGGTETIVDCSL